jgi:carbonic anhydrase
VLDIAPGDVGIGDRPGEAPVQRPFAAVLGCGDARAPVELVLGQHANELFVVRVAGNVLSEACQGSLAYAVHHFESLRLLVVLGHARCGVLTAGVDAYTTPREYVGTARHLPLRAIVDAVMPTIRWAAYALEVVHGPSFAATPGYRDALIEMSVALHAGLTASIVRHEFAAEVGPNLEVAFGVYDLVSHQVGIPAATGWEAGLFAPPTDEEEIVALAERLARSVTRTAE